MTMLVSGLAVDRSLLQISKHRVTIHPLGQELLDSLPGKVVSPAELNAVPASNKVELDNAPLNAGTRLVEARCLRRETYPIGLNCSTQCVNSHLRYVHHAALLVCSHISQAGDRKVETLRCETDPGTGTQSRVRSGCTPGGRD